MSHPRADNRFLKIIATSFALSLMALPTGCATYIKYLCHNVAPTNTFVTLETTPSGATAKLSNGRTVTTPIRLVLRSGEPVTVTFTKDGYQPAEVQLGPGLNWWVFGNLLALPPFGFFIDPEQGACTRLYWSGIHVDLVSVAKADTRLDTSLEPKTEPAAAN